MPSPVLHKTPHYILASDFFSGNNYSIPKTVRYSGAHVVLPNFRLIPSLSPSVVFKRKLIRLDPGAKVDCWSSRTKFRKKNWNIVVGAAWENVSVELGRFCDQVRF